MKLTRPPRRVSDDGHLIPLINVIFLMLIFFMLIGRITASEPLEVKPPASGSGRATDAAETVLLIDADGRLALGNRRIERRELADAVASLGGSTQPRLTIKADAKLKAGQLREVLDLLRDAGAEAADLMTVGRR